MRNALAVSLFVAACGGGSDNSDKVVINDAPTTTKKDAPVTTGSDSTTVPTCHVNSTVTYTATSGAVADEDADPPTQYLAFDDNLNADAMPDILEVYLAPGQGVFSAGAPTTGTFTISGDETDYGACGACVTIYGDSPDPTMFDYTQLYQASSGTLTISSVTGNLSGEIKNVVLKAVTFDQTNGQADDGSGCTATIADATFTAPITNDGAFTGKHGTHAKLHLHRK